MCFVVVGRHGGSARPNANIHRTARMQCSRPQTWQTITACAEQSKCDNLGHVGQWELSSTWERRPELIQLVLARLADMVDACCASCIDPSKAPSYSACTMHLHLFMHFFMTTSIASQDVCPYAHTEQQYIAFRLICLANSVTAAFQPPHVN